MQNTETKNPTQKKGSYVLSITIIGILFFIFGFVTWLNGILIPYLKIACELSDFQALFVTFAFYISYFVMALPSSWVLKKTGFKNGMMIGLLVMAVGALIFVPAAQTRIYSVFLLGLFIMGTGLALLQTASNPYITIIGPQETAARRISIMGICNKIAGAIAPLVLAYFVFAEGEDIVEKLKGLDEAARVMELDQMASRVIFPYEIMAIVLVLLGLMVRFSPLPEIESEEEEIESDAVTAKTSILQFPQLILGVIALFLYVGVEVIAGDTIIRYGNSIGIPMDLAKYYTSLVLIAMVIGYILGIALMPKIISQKTALIWSSILGFVFSLLVMLIPIEYEIRFPFIDIQTFSPIEMVLPVTVLFVALLGFANAMVWPAIWPLALNGLGRFIKTGSALLVMAIAGGAILPLIWGKFSDVLSSQMAYWVLIPCYLFIFGYAFVWHNKKSW